MAVNGTHARNGSGIPFSVVERTPSEQALIQVIHEAFLNGVSTRRVERLAKAPGLQGIPAIRVSEIPVARTTGWMPSGVGPWGPNTR